MNTTTETETEAVTKGIRKAHRDCESERLQRYASHIVMLQSFIQGNIDKLCDLNWHACHIYGRMEITIGNVSGNHFEQDARKIARRWPGRVWIRTKNAGVCGVIDWVSKPDEPGVEIVIQSAEVIKWSPEPNTEVKP